MKRIVCFIMFAITTCHVQAQTLMNLDSLLKILPAVKQDSNAVLLYIDIGQQYEASEPEKAKQYYLMARDLSRKINYPKGIIKYITNFTYVLNMQGLYDSALTLNQQSVDLSRKINDSLYLGKTLFNTGSSYRNLGEYETAVKYYEEGKNLFSKIGAADVEAQANDILQVLFYNLKQYNRAIVYGEKAVSGARALKELPLLGMALNNLGMSYGSAKNLEKASGLYGEALTIARSIGDKNMELTQYLNLGDLALRQHNFNTLKMYAEKALPIAKELDTHEGEMIALKSMALYYGSIRDYTLAKQYASQALTISYQYNYKIERARVFSQLSNIAYAEQDPGKGAYYATQSELLGDSLLNESIQKNALEIEKKYEVEKKENQIKQLEAEKKIQQYAIRQKNILNYILIASAFLILIILLLSLRNYRQKQKLQQQRIADLETQQQLMAAEAVLKGEEQERTRLAKDLHDGLGGMLSGIKYSFNTMKGNLVMTPDNARAFERSMDMLDSSIQEMRRVAHNMMPEALVKFGLDTALRDFCNDINQSGALQVNYHSAGLENTMLDQTTAITIYRIVQELVNNTMKHAAASTAVVQITREENQLSITVEDNGKGFDTRLLQQSKGIGWTNIQNRVDFLKGRLDVRADQEKGTSVFIELSV